MNNRGRALWEWLVFVSVLVVAIALMGSTYSAQQRLLKEKNMHGQLQILRMGEMLYTSVNNVKPNSLKQLVEGTFTLPGDNLARHYIEHPPTLVNGNLLDPFGNPYTYDPVSGWIKSTTPGYEFW